MVHVNFHDTVLLLNTKMFPELVGPGPCKWYSRVPMIGKDPFRRNNEIDNHLSVIANAM